MHQMDARMKMWCATLAQIRPLPENTLLADRLRARVASPRSSWEDQRAIDQHVYSVLGIIAARCGFAGFPSFQFLARASAETFRPP